MSKVKVIALLKNVARHLGRGITAQTQKHYGKIIVISTAIGASLYYREHIPQTPFEFYKTPPQLVSQQITSRENYNFIVNVTKQCAPSVVSVEVRNNLRTNIDGEPMVASSGSGFVVRKDGWIMTNAHVVMNKPNSSVSVITCDGSVYDAEVHDIDLKLDLALLKIQCNKSNELKPLPLGNSNEVMTGEWVVALGNPLSLKKTITAGVISSIDRDARDLGISNKSMKYIQTDASITFGHSGGPLVNLDGEAIGVNNLRITAGIAFAIPINYAREFLQRSSMNNITTQSSQALQISNESPQFGITTLTMDKEILKKLLKDQNIRVPKQEQGIFIWKVTENSPAQKAGLIVGDIITHINNKPIKSPADVYNKLTKRKLTDKVTFTIYRRGEKKLLTFNTDGNNVTK